MLWAHTDCCIAWPSRSEHPSTANQAFPSDISQIRQPIPSASILLVPNKTDTWLTATELALCFPCRDLVYVKKWIVSLRCDRICGLSLQTVPLAGDVNSVSDFPQGTRGGSESLWFPWVSQEGRGCGDLGSPFSILVSLFYFPHYYYCTFILRPKTVFKHVP